MTAARAIADMPGKGAMFQPGTIAYFARATAPYGWLLCDGANVSRTTYADLFAAIGTEFGAGDGATTFGMPDLRGEFIRGWDGGRGVDAGRAFGSAQADEFKSHTHSVTNGSSIRRQSGNSLNDASSNSGSYTTISISTTGGPETRPRNIAMLGCIKT